MVADDRNASPGIWRIHLPEGDVIISGEIRAPDGSTWSEEQANQEIELALKTPIRPAEGLFAGAVMTTMMVPILLWVSALVMVFWFLLNVWKPPGTFP